MTTRLTAKVRSKIGATEMTSATLDDALDPYLAAVARLEALWAR